MDDARVLRSVIEYSQEKKKQVPTHLNISKSFATGFENTLH